jgi:hypothetical protein
MTKEAPGPTHHEPQRLEALLLATLSENDGLCLDNKEERRQLATILANALVATGREEAESEVSTVVVRQQQERARWPEPTSELPSLQTLEEWESDGGGCEATDGCWVEPDGVCPHGHPSWLLWLGDD